MSAHDPKRTSRPCEPMPATGEQKLLCLPNHTGGWGERVKFVVKAFALSTMGRASVELQVRRVTGPHQSPPQLHLVRQRRSQAANASLHLALHLCQASSGSRPRSRARAQRSEQ